MEEQRRSEGVAVSEEESIEKNENGKRGGSEQG